MFEYIQHYSSNKSKLFDFGIEILYAFSLLFFAGQLYGEEISFDNLISGAKTISIDFFQDIIGISLAYLLIAVLVQLCVIIIVLISSALIEYASYLRYNKKLKASSKLSFRDYKNWKENKLIYNEAALIIFRNLNEEQFSKTKDYYLGKKATLQSSRIFVILLAYIVIDSCFRPNGGFSIMDWVLLPVLLLVVSFYVHASQLEDTVSQPDFFSKLHEYNTIKELRQLIRRNKSCFQKISRKEKGTVKENVFFVYNKGGRVIGWIIIVDQEMMTGVLMESIFKRANVSKGSFKILLDIFDLIPDQYSELENLKVVKSVDKFNLNKAVNELLLK